MAFSIVQVSLSPSIPYPNSPKLPLPNVAFQIKPRPTFPKLINHTPLLTRTRISRQIITRATQESTNSNTTSEAQEPKTDENPLTKGQITEADDDASSQLGVEIKRAMKERAEKEQDTLSLNGVLEEIREIEWPAFNRVLGTTWVVLGIIAGSSVVLLTLNAVLAELSDRVFAGRGVQDFF